MRFLLLLVAAVVAIFAGVAALQLSGAQHAADNAPVTGTNTMQQSANSANVLTVDVLVARQPIPAGTEITAAMIDRQPWPENLVLDGFIVGNGPDANVIGKVTRATLQAREPLIASKLAAPGDSGFLAASLPEGMRAITIALDAITGVAGYVFPGDRIDIILTHDIPGKGKSASAGGGGASLFQIPGMPSMPTPAGGGGDGAAYAEVLVPNVPVLAINIRQSDNAGGAGADGLVPGAASAILGGAGSSTTPSSMTLQVTDIQAEKIRLAERAGNISISLRSLKDRSNTTPTPPTDLGSLTQVHLSPEVQQQIQSNDEVKVVRGGMNSAPPPAAGGFGMFTPPVAR